MKSSFPIVKRELSAQTFDKVLLYLHSQASGTKSLMEFKLDCERIRSLQRSIRRKINGCPIKYLEFHNTYLIIKNTFGENGLVVISYEYFAHDDKLFEYFCSLVYHFEGYQISKRMDSAFLKFLSDNALDRKHKNI